MNMRFVFLFIAVGFLSCCATYKGVPVTDTSFKADGGKVIRHPMTRYGSVPAENEHYRIEGTGFMGALKKGSAQESLLTFTFSFVAKQPVNLESVQVEEVTPEGQLKTMVKDQAPELNKNKNWVGRTAAVPMTRTSVPWLYEPSDTVMLYKFTITAKGEAPVVMYQPSLTVAASKALYLKVMNS